MKLLRIRTWLVLGTRPPPEVFQASAKLPSIPQGGINASDVHDIDDSDPTVHD